MFEKIKCLFQKNTHQEWLLGKAKFFDKIMSKQKPSLYIKKNIADAKSVTFLYKKGAHSFRGHNLEIVFKGKKIFYIGEENWEKSDIFICLAFFIDTDDIFYPQIENINKPIFIAEETFLRSITPSSGAPNNCEQKFLDAVSHFIDERSPHFYSKAISSLEYMLNSDIEISPENIKYSRQLINKIIDNNLSKYNSQPIKDAILPSNTKKNILIIDQVYGDMAINFNNGSSKDFKKMLNVAIKENPNANIIIKSHVDKRKGNYANISDSSVYMYKESINMISLLKKIDTVYVYSSAAGMEAILMGKKVKCFGSPIYAGWGLTDDVRKLPNRTKKRSIEELFYIIYVLYSFYINPITQSPCSIDEALDILINLRTEYLDKYNIV